MGLFKGNLLFASIAATNSYKTFCSMLAPANAVIYEYGNEVASRTGKNSGLTHNYSSGSPQCYDTKPDKKYLG